MSECICGKQSPSSILYVRHITCRGHDNVLDPWHYTGNASWHKDVKSEESLSFCREKLPQRKLPIWVGHTGYVNAKKDIFTELNRWCYDELGRMVVLLDGLLMFQQYQQGDLIMRSTNGQIFSSVGRDRLPEFISRVMKEENYEYHPITSECY